MSREPGFFIVGAPKCGTTTLAAWLRAHPAIYLPRIKEPNFHNPDIVASRVADADAYARLFAGADGRHLAVGEASATYLLSRVAIPAIERRYDRPKYIVLLRDPVDMAHSLYYQNLRSGRERAGSFREAWRRCAGLAPDDPGYSVNFDYRRACLLGEHLAFLFAHAPRERVLVLFMDDLKADPRGVYLATLAFLGVPDDGRTEFAPENLGGTFRSPLLARAFRALHAARRALPLPPLGSGIIERMVRMASRSRYLPLEADLHEEMRRFFAEDERRLEELLARPLPWRTRAGTAPAECRLLPAPAPDARTP